MIVIEKLTDIILIVFIITGFSFWYCQLLKLVDWILRKLGAFDK